MEEQEEDREAKDQLEREKLAIKSSMQSMCGVYDQSVCSIMSVEGSKKKKKKDESQKETMNEDFLTHIKILNPQFDPKKMKHENLNELLMFNYNKNTLSQDFDKLFEKTVRNSNKTTLSPKNLLRSTTM